VIPASPTKIKEISTMNGNEILRDRHGNKLGEVVIRGSISTLHDKHGDRVGQYDTHDGFTRDKYGNVIGGGDLLVTLLK
jgi:hypothetical protein